MLPMKGKEELEQIGKKGTGDLQLYKLKEDAEDVSQ